MKPSLPRCCAICGLVPLLAIGCGRSSRSGGGVAPSPSPNPGGGGNVPIITIANNAVTPKAITVTRGSQVLFANNDNQAHEMDSDPHPVHTDCPEINQVGFLTPGQTRMTGTFNTARVCGYHDHNRETVVALQGTITVQ